MALLNLVYEDVFGHTETLQSVVKYLSLGNASFSSFLAEGSDKMPEMKPDLARLGIAIATFSKADQ